MSLEEAKVAGKSSASFTGITQILQVLLSVFPAKYRPSHYGLNVHNLLGNNYLK